MRIGIVGLVLITASGFGDAQSQPPPKFDVSVVKSFELRPDSSVQWSCQGGRFLSTGVPLINVIRAAYQILWDFSVPAWADLGGQRYFIEGKADSPLSQQDCWLATRSLLEDRFKLSLHREKKETPAYDLILAKGGANLREFTPGASGDGIWIRGQRWSTIGWSSFVIAIRLGNLPEIGRPVVDKTGLKGQYQFRLNYAIRPDDDKPDIFTALQEQLGLKLVPSKTTAEFVVIDHIEKPSLEN